MESTTKMEEHKEQSVKAETKKRPSDTNIEDEEDDEQNGESANHDNQDEAYENRCCPTDGAVDNNNTEPKPRILTPPNPNSKRQQKKRRNEIKQKKKMVCIERNNSDLHPVWIVCKSNHDVELFLKHADPPIGDYCYLFDIRGKCPFGWNCRFLPAHMKDNKLVVDQEKLARCKVLPEINALKNDLQKKLRTKKYKFVRATPLIEQYQKEKNSRKLAQAALDLKSKAKESNNNNNTEEAEQIEDTKVLEDKEDVVQSESATFVDTEVPLKLSEKKKLDVKGKLYLAPLTTIGNLPYRRICKEFGVDITCGEMALAPNLLQGQASEWALLKRHPIEDFFGVQICGPYMDLLTRCSEVLDEALSVDFVDINMGCPIDLVVNQGAGSALLENPRKLQDIVTNVAKVLTKPLTIKVRIGKDETQPTIHKLFPKLESWGVSAVTIHGRSRMQRYSREPNWDYIKQCTTLTNLPVIGNGDIFNYEDYVNHVENHGVAAVMLARGAIIKPWLSTEIKERKHWDISAQERLDIVRKYCYYGLDHWGSDTQGVENTRRFFLEWQSFLHRYIPVGLSEVMPPKIKGYKPANLAYRSDLEAQLASPDVKDWIKLSEMFLGPVPDNFTFTPKHKANANG